MMDEMYMIYKIRTGKPQGAAAAAIITHIGGEGYMRKAVLSLHVVKLTSLVFMCCVRVCKGVGVDLGFGVGKCVWRQIRGGLESVFV